MLEHPDWPLTFNRKRVGRLLFWVLLILFGWMVWRNQGELDELVHTLRRGRPLWIAMAIAAQMLYSLLYAMIYWSAFDTVGIRMRPVELVHLSFAALFVNSTVTSAGAAGTLLFVEAARHRGFSGARATAGTLLVLAADFSAFALILTAGLALLIAKSDLTLLESISALIMYVLVVGVFSLLSLGLWFPRGLRTLLSFVESIVRRGAGLIHAPDPLGAGWADRNADEFTAAAMIMSQQPGLLLRSVGMALLSHLARLCVLMTLFLGFQQLVFPDTLIILYAMTMLFWIVSPTPNGIGVVETVMPAIYASVNVPLETGIVINLAFRGITFWLPLLFGFYFVRRLQGAGTD